MEGTGEVIEKEVIGFVEKVKGFLLSPTATFQKVKGEEMGAAIKYYIMFLVIYAILFTIIAVTIGAMAGGLFGAFSSIPGFEQFGAATGATVGLTCGIGYLIMILIGGIIGLFIYAGIIHLGVLLVGGKNGYSQTVKAMAYGYTPTLLLGWIPIIGLIFAIWTLVIAIIGVKELQDISTGKAIVAVFIIPLVIIIIITCLISATIFTYISGMIGSLPN